ncbi:MAG: hypothetical protein FWC71_02840 [Defluviitaleaceae bacterium]|nr:hypothetical protein [Defluviitaleaceae bacterium]
MAHENNNPITEVRRNREQLLNKYDGVEGLHRHMDAERDNLETQGWKFVSVEDVLAKNRKMQELRA